MITDVLKKKIVVGVGLEPTGMRLAHGRHSKPRQERKLLSQYARTRAPHIRLNVAFAPIVHSQPFPLIVFDIIWTVDLLLFVIIFEH